jgi:hypothetical protein
MGNQMIFIAGLIFSFAVSLAASFFYPGGFALAQASRGSGGNIVNIILLALLMLVGIFASFVFAKSKDAKARGVSFSIGLAEITRDWEFLGALFVSPLIFNSVYALTQQNPETLGDFLLAFQNGFFWQTVLSGIVGRTTSSAGRLP